MNEQNQDIAALHDIRRMMQRSSRFLSLSGLSGIAAGFWALIGAYIAFNWINVYQQQNNGTYSAITFHELKLKLLLLAAAVLIAALICAFYFTWRRANKSGVPLWDHTAKMLTANMLIPLVSGGLLILTMLQHNNWHFVAPLSLIFYGLALVNGSKYTLSDIRYLGLLEIILGLVNTQFIGYSLYFWAMGFGVLHLLYGFVMWWKNERTAVEGLSINNH